MVESDLDRVMAIADSLPTAPHWSRPAYEAAIDPEGAPRRVALVAEAGGEVAGFVVAAVIVPEAEIETIAVDGPAQGYGFGSSLLHAVFEELKLVGVGEVALEVRASNENALWFYRKMGFEEVGRRRGYYREPVEDAVLLRLELS
jgi:ribosomal-protein-alanine N-acetyltransferase